MAWCFIVGDAGALTTDETAVRAAAAAALGIGTGDIELIDDTGVEPGDISGKDVILSFSPSSVSINTAIGAALKATNRTVISLAGGIGVLVNALALTDSRQVGSTVGTVEVPDTAYDGGAEGSAKAWYVDSGAFGEPVDTTSRVGAGFVGIAAQTSDATRHAAFGYPAGSVLADGTTANGPRFYLEARSASQWQTTGGGGAAFQIFAAMLGGSGGSVINPALTVYAAVTRAGQAVDVVARASVAGDAISSLSINGPGAEGSPFITGIGTTDARNETPYTPQATGAATENLTVTANTGSGGSASMMLPTRVLDTLRRQLVPNALDAEGGVTSFGGGTPLVADVADLPDIENGIAIPSSDSGDDNNVLIFGFAAVSAPPAGTSGTLAAVLSLDDGVTDPMDVTVQLVDTGGAALGTIRTSGGSNVGGGAASFEVSEAEAVALFRELSSSEIATIDFSQLAARITVTPAA